MLSITYRKHLFLILAIGFTKELHAEVCVVLKTVVLGISFDKRAARAVDCRGGHNVGLEVTIVGCEIYFPDRVDPSAMAVLRGKQEAHVG